MAEFISHEKFKRKQQEASGQQPSEPNRLGKAEQHRREQASTLAREANRVAEKIGQKFKITRDDRRIFAGNMHIMLQQLKQKDPHLVAAAFQEGIGAKVEESTKRRGRFARDLKNRDLKTPLAASGRQWIALARAVGNHLHGESRAILRLVEGSSFSSNNAPLLSGNDLREEAAQTAEYLCDIAAQVSRRNNLKNYFKTFQNSSYGFTEDGAFCFESWVFAIDPSCWFEGSRFGFNEIGEEYIYSAIPKIKLFTKDICIPASGTRQSLPHSNDDSKAWDALADIGGVVDFNVKIQEEVSFGICPLNMDEMPNAVFIVGNPKISVDVDGNTVEINQSLFRGDWIIFQHGIDKVEEWSALRLRPQTKEQEEIVEKLATFALSYVSLETCLHLLSNHCHECDSIKLSFEDNEPDFEEVEKRGTAAPSRTILAAVQRNLAYVEQKKKISFALDEQAASLARKLQSVREQELEEFAQKIAEVRKQWKMDDTQE